MPVALILIDALPPAYVSQALLPVINMLAQDGYAGPLANIYAYRGIEATLFSGKLPDEHGVWGEFRPAQDGPAEQLNRLTQLMIKLGDCLPNDRLRLDARYVALRVLQAKRRIPMGNLIPPELLRAFTTSIERPVWEAQSLGPIPTLFEEVQVAGGLFEPVIYPAIRLDHEINAYVRARLARGQLPDFWYIKFSALDALGHTHGPDIAKLAPALNKLNVQLTQLVLQLRQAYTSTRIDIVVVSDHGMSRVNYGIDVRPMLQRLGFELGRDYLYFLDSTTIRFWGANPLVSSVIANSFAGVAGMHVLNANARQRLHIPNDAGTGDVLVALDEGYVIAPDFFRKDAPPLGMHGYAQVNTLAGLPFLAAEPALANLLPGHSQLGHADVWAAMRQRLGLAVETPLEAL